MRNVYFSVRWALCGAGFGALLPALVLFVPGLTVGDFLVPGSWVASACSVGGAVGFVIGGLAGPAVVEAGEGLFERVSRWVPWLWP